MRDGEQLGLWHAEGRGRGGGREMGGVMNELGGECSRERSVHYNGRAHNTTVHRSGMGPGLSSVHSTVHSDYTVQYVHSITPDSPAVDLGLGAAGN